MARVLGSKHCSIANILLGAHEVILEGLRADFATQPVDPACPKLGRYLMVSMGSLSDEVLRILFLDCAHRLIADEQLQHGTVRDLGLYPRTIFRRAMEHSATGVILVHNHPSGDPTPSENDIRVTRKLAELGRSLDIEIVDHLVVTPTRVRRVSALESHRTDRTMARTHILCDSVGPDTSDLPGNRLLALQNARRAFRRRKFRREAIGPAKLFGEPAWDMLIDLFIHECEGKKVPISALCLASYSPQSTALRLVNKLCAARHAVKIKDFGDGRRHFIELTPQTSKRLEAYFGTEEW